jgi:hypothetical protein
MSTPPFDDTAFRRGFAHALREVQRGLALAAERELSVQDVAGALASYQEAVEDWRKLPADRYAEQPAFRPGDAAPVAPHDSEAGER